MKRKHLEGDDCYFLAVSSCATTPNQVAPNPSSLPSEPTPEQITLSPAASSPSPLPVEPTTEQATASPAAGADVLTIEGHEEALSFTMEELQALPAASGQAGMKSSTGKITVLALYKGVLLTDLVSLVGGLTPTSASASSSMMSML